MGLDVSAAPSKAFIETLRSWLTELEHLEATGAATPDSSEMLVELHELLDNPGSPTELDFCDFSGV